MDSVLKLLHVSLHPVPISNSHASWESEAQIHIFTFSHINVVVIEWMTCMCLCEFGFSTWTVRANKFPNHTIHVHMRTHTHTHTHCSADLASTFHLPSCSTGLGVLGHIGRGHSLGPHHILPTAQFHSFTTPPHLFTQTHHVFLT